MKKWKKEKCTYYPYLCLNNFYGCYHIGVSENKKTNPVHMVDTNDMVSAKVNGLMCVCVTYVSMAISNSWQVSIT